MSKAQYLGPISPLGVALTDAYRWQCTYGHEDVEWQGTSLESVCWYCGTDLRAAGVVTRSRFSKNFYDAAGTSDEAAWRQRFTATATYEAVHTLERDALENASDRH